MIEPKLAAAYRSWETETIRYNDTDRQGHVNNAVFATLLETGRAPLLYSQDRSILEPATAFVIARLELDFKTELRWPGEAHIGTRVSRIGRSSVTLGQAIFQDGTCAALAVSVIVLMDETTRKSRQLPDAAVVRFRELQLEPSD